MSKSINSFSVAITARACKGLKTCGRTGSRCCNALNVRVTFRCYIAIGISIAALCTSMSCISCCCASGFGYNRLIAMVTSYCALCKVVCCGNLLALKNVESESLILYVRLGF